MEFKHELVKPNNDINIKFIHATDYGRFVSSHWHSSMEIIYILDGTLDVTINGITHILNADDLIVISPKCIHSTNHQLENTSILLQIPFSILQNNISNINNIFFKCYPDIITAKNSTALQNIKALLKEFATIYDSKPNCYTLKATSLLYDILFILINSFGVYSEIFDQKKSERYFDRLSLITQYVKEHYSECIDLNTISNEVGLNPEYFSRFFKKYMGTTFLKYLNNIRLEHVHSELLNTDYSISEIIERNGFTSYKQFISIFKETYGCKPSDIRKDKNR